MCCLWSLKIVQEHIKERGLLNASHHSTTVQCTMLTDHVTLNFSNSTSMATGFLDIEKPFDITCHTGLLYKLSKLEFRQSHRSELSES